ncbi:imidazole glycerol phosphate synthase subunit HisH [Geomonas subterranea]|uniref:Imidazole glycerol phosphate synthase subunit HisH n=1 Tax=Geomonas subterranea TaxID=2847989 RepID=A0ABX8LFW9_9BACT|nr:imidazole glycerol phosphate synthase subunit HisH [Geomonas subterranea]QXE90364.1 imidazole glycerol phosphate synthase subunit HisH [Geomonas subterranea]QXM07508.1 imidazole glycerol phosphate synthase subunit HisH [Geomonas subterranea]
MKKPGIAIVDYGLGNVRSIVNGVEKVGGEPMLTREPSELLAADGLVLPGVGSFISGMERLTGCGLIDCIREYAAGGKPMIGICLGMQLLFDRGEEFGVTAGLALLSGEVKLLPAVAKLPHMAWNGILPPQPGRWDGTPFAGVRPGEDMYFVHSYAAVPAEESDILSITDFGGYNFVSAVQRGNITGCQFHPEKSGGAGLGILSAWVESCR